MKTTMLRCPYLCFCLYAIFTGYYYLFFLFFICMQCTWPNSSVNCQPHYRVCCIVQNYSFPISLFWRTDQFRVVMLFQLFPKGIPCPSLVHKKTAWHYNLGTILEGGKFQLGIVMIDSWSGGKTESCSFNRMRCYLSGDVTTSMPEKGSAAHCCKCSLY